MSTQDKIHPLHESRFAYLGKVYVWRLIEGRWRLFRETEDERGGRYLLSWVSVLREKLAADGRVVLDELAAPVPTGGGLADERVQRVATLAMAARKLIREGEAALAETGVLVRA